MKVSAPGAWRLLDRAATLAMLLASTTIVVKLLATRSAALPSATLDGLEAADGTISQEVLTDSERKGSPHAVVALIEFADFQCPYCRQYATQVYPQIERDYVLTGRVMYVFLNLPLEQIHPNSTKAAESAACAATAGGFWDFRSKLFADTTSLTDPALLRYAQESHLDQAKFRNCLNEGLMVARIQRHVAIASRFGIDATPEFLIGRIEDAGISIVSRIRGSRRVEVFETALNSVLQHSRQSRLGALLQGLRGQ